MTTSEIEQPEDTCVTGTEIIKMCEDHVLSTMASLAECQPGAKGLGNREIEEHAGLALSLPYQDGWLTWSLLHYLVQQGRFELVSYAPGTTGFKVISLLSLKLPHKTDARGVTIAV